MESMHKDIIFSVKFPTWQVVSSSLDSPVIDLSMLTAVQLTGLELASLWQYHYIVTDSQVGPQQSETMIINIISEHIFQKF